MTDLYPEHEKLTRHVRLSDVTQTLGEHLEGSGQRLCERRCEVDGKRVPEDCDREDHHVEWWPLPQPINSQLASIFGIDLDALEAEKRAMLDRLRQDQAGIVVVEPHDGPPHQYSTGEPVPPNPPHTFGPATTCPVDGCPVVVCGDPACDCGDHTHDQPETEESPL